MVVRFTDIIEIGSASPWRVSDACPAGEETKTLWYSSQETRIMRRRDRTLIRRMSRGEKLDFDEDTCTLGLKSRNGAVQRRMRIRLAVMSVLMEQQLQWNTGKEDPVLIASVCRSTSRSSAEAAGKRGLDLAHELGQEHQKATARTTFVVNSYSKWNCKTNRSITVLSQTSSPNGAVKRWETSSIFQKNDFSIVLPPRR